MKRKRKSVKGDNRVLVRKCETYDRGTIRDIVADGMRELGYKPHGRVFVKPNVVFAGDREKFGETAYTSPDLVAGALMGIAVDGVKRIEVGENTAVGFPTRWCYKNAGYYDMVGALLLGFSVAEVPYLRRAVERAYLPSRIEDVRLMGDIRTLAGLDAHSKRIDRKSDRFKRWHNIPKELKRLGSPMRFYWGRRESARISRGKKHADPLLPEQCNTGCLMGVKMFLSFLEHYADREKFRKSKPVVLVVGCVDEEIDADGGDVIMVGCCADATVRNARKTIRLDQCFVTTSYLTMQIGGRIGMPNPLTDPRFVVPLVYNYIIASFMKVLTFRYLQDAYNFTRKNWMKKI